LRLTGARGRVVLEVRDQGRGFDPDLVDGGEAIGNRLGLLGMRERIAQIGGTFDLVSRPGEGTRVRIVAPLGGPGSERGDRSGAPR